MFFNRTKGTKSTKMQISDFNSNVFIRTKSTKDTKLQARDFFLFRCFYAHKNTVFFMHIKSIKTQLSE